MTPVATKLICVRGYHICKDVWAVVVGEEFVCRRGRGNSHNVYAVSVTKDSVIVGHFPRKISPVASLFLKKGGTILSSTGVQVSRSLEYFWSFKF